MNHIGTQLAETGRLKLRQFQLADSDMMYQNWVKDDLVTTFLTWPTHQSIEITNKVISSWVATYDNPKYYQ